MRKEDTKPHKVFLYYKEECKVYLPQIARIVRIWPGLYHWEHKELFWGNTIKALKDILFSFALMQKKQKIKATSF
jgi:hypothetical protein